MTNEYKSFYKADLIHMINEAALDTIGVTPADMDGDQIAARVRGVLALSEKLKDRLNDPEVE